MRPGPDTGGIEPAEHVHGPVDQFLDRVFPGLVRRIRHNLHPQAKSSQLRVQSVFGISQNKVMTSMRHLECQRRHHVRLGVCEYHYSFFPAVHGVMPGQNIGSSRGQTGGCIERPVWTGFCVMGAHKKIINQRHFLFLSISATITDLNQ